MLKPIASATAIGTGGPFGAEDPIIMTGGAFGSLFSQIFRLTAAECKTFEPVSRVADRMAERDVNCVPILDSRSNVLVGMLSCHEV